MDPLSITAACVSLTASITKTSHSITVFVRAVRAARGDLDVIARELASLTTLLGILGEDAEDIENFPETLRGNIISILSNCELVLVEVTRIISKYDRPGVVSGSKWVLAGSEDVTKLRLSLEAHKTALEIALQMVTLSMTKEIKQDTTHLLDDTAAIKNDTSEILQEIARLRAQLPDEHALLRPSTKDSDSTLARYLDDLESYAEAVCWSGEDSDTDVEQDDKKTPPVSKATYSTKFVPSLPPMPRKPSRLVKPPSQIDTTNTQEVPQPPDHSKLVPVPTTKGEVTRQHDNTSSVMLTRSIGVTQPMSTSDCRKFSSMTLSARPTTNPPGVGLVGGGQRTTVLLPLGSEAKDTPEVSTVPKQKSISNATTRVDSDRTLPGRWSRPHGSENHGVESTYNTLTKSAPPPVPVFVEPVPLSSPDRLVHQDRYEGNASSKPCVSVDTCAKSAEVSQVGAKPQNSVIMGMSMQSEISKLVSLGSTSQLSFNARPILFTVKAVLDCDAEYENQLTFRRGQIIHVLETNGSRWYTGYIDGSTFCGIFPKWYVEKQELYPIHQQSSTSQRYSSKPTGPSASQAATSMKREALPRPGIEHSVTESAARESISSTQVGSRSVSADPSKFSTTLSKTSSNQQPHPTTESSNVPQSGSKQVPPLRPYSLNTPVSDGTMFTTKSSDELTNSTSDSLDSIMDHRSGWHAYRNTASTDPRSWRFHDDLTTSTKESLKLYCHDRSGQTLVVKSYARTSKDGKSYNVKIIREAEILGLLDHPHIIRLHYFARTSDSWLLYLEDARPSTLSQYISQHGITSADAQTNTTWDASAWERQVREFARQIGSALRYLQLNCIHHYSLQADKILVDRNGDTKITGFGSIQLVSTFYDQCFDTFCYGTILWHMGCGSVPWPVTENWNRHLRTIDTPLMMRPAHLSSDFFSLISGLLNDGMALRLPRLPLKKALEHPWMSKGYDVAVPDYMPKRKPITTVVDFSTYQKLTLLDFGATEYIQREIARIITSLNYEDSRSIWTYNAMQAGTIVVGLRQNIKMGWRHGGAKKRAQSSQWKGPPPEFDSLEFWELVRSRIASPTLAMYYLAKEKLARENAKLFARD